MLAEYHKELQTAKDIAKLAGKMMISGFSERVDSETKADRTIVTKTDKAINGMVIQSIREGFPSHSIIGEEESFLVKGSSFAWVCDPIDGTLPFALGIPVSTFSLALVKDGVPVLGVAYDPFRDEMYTAVKGHGAFKNNAKIRVDDNLQRIRSPIGISIGESPLVKIGPVMGDIVKDYWPWDMGSVVYMGVLAACGKLQGLIFLWPHAHDVAAIKVIIEEAGGICTDLNGNDQRYDRTTKGFIAATPSIHGDLVRILRLHRKW